MERPPWAQSCSGQLRLAPAGKDLMIVKLGRSLTALPTTNQGDHGHAVLFNGGLHTGSAERDAGKS
jgi:hypothetical protein